GREHAWTGSCGPPRWPPGGPIPTRSSRGARACGACSPSSCGCATSRTWSGERGRDRAMRIAVVGNGRSVHVTGPSAALAARGHDVRLVTLGPVLPAPGVDTRSRPIPHTLREAARAGRTFLADIATFSPDVLHLHYAGGLLGTMASLADVHPF